MTGSNKTAASTPMVVLAFATVYIVWGSTYFFIQKALHGFPPMLLGAVRFIIAGLLMLGWSILRGEKVWGTKQVKFSAISGILMLFVGNGAVIWVEQFMPSAMVAIMVSSSPFWFILLDRPKWKENLGSKAIIICLLIGFGGVVLLFGEKIVASLSAFGNPAEIGGMVLITLGAISWAGGSLYSKYKSVNVSASVNTAWQMLAAGLAFVPLSLLHGETTNFNWQTIPANAWFSLLYLIFFGSIAGFSAYVWLLQVRPATQVSTYAYVNPVVAVLLGIFFANEHITLLQIFGLVTILFSVFLINLAKYRNNRQLPKQDDANGMRLLQDEPVAKQVQSVR